MAEKDIIQNMIFQQGQSQDQRMPAELGIHFADVDERTQADFLLFTRKFAEFVNFYRDSTSAPVGDWADFFPENFPAIEKLIEDNSGATTPHLALFLSFLKLFKQGPQEMINRFTGRHLDFYFKDVLRFEHQPAVADKAHLLLELKKNMLPIVVGPSDIFTAGKDKKGIELHYQPSRETIINTAVIDSIRSVYYDKSGKGIIRYAPIANSSDGMGGNLSGDEPKWFGFGTENLPAIENGFAFSSPVLRMAEGTRKVTVTLNLENADPELLTDDVLKGAFEVYISGAKKWFGPYSISPSWVKDGQLAFDFTVPSSEKAIVNYDAAVHGYRFNAQAPVMQVMLRAAIYNDLNDIILTSASILVEVSDVTGLKLENDNGSLNPKKAFLPFGSLPVRGSRFLIGYEEALSKNISEISVKLDWKNPPANFATYYQAYNVGASNSGFTVQASFTYDGDRKYSNPSAALFNSINAAAENTLTFTPGHIEQTHAGGSFQRISAFRMTGMQWSKNRLAKELFLMPILEFFPASKPADEAGFIALTLNSSFFHAEYLKKSVENVVNYSKGSGSPAFAALNEPYTPAIQQISLSYKAHSDEVAISSSSVDDFANDDLQFFHLAYAGQMREHSYQRSQFNFLVDKKVSLLPNYENEGEMILGFKNLSAGDSVSVLFQVADGSENPELQPASLSWSVLVDNYWKPLGTFEVILDTTNNLLRSGIIQFVIPAEASKENTLLPPGPLWLKAGIANNTRSVCQLISVDANAIEVQFRDQGNDPAHLTMALEPGKISKLLNGIAFVKAIRQPYSSFGGKTREQDNPFYTRVSERLRHKNRSITAWDYERMILQNFPEVHKVKCIPHAKFLEESGKYCWLAPGNVVLVLVPDLRNRNAVDPLKPKVNSDTISRIGSFLQTHTGMQVNVKIKNPSYQQVQVECKVKLRKGFEFNFYSKLLVQKITEFLSPWAFESGLDISFGGRIYKSVLINFVEELEFVDFIEDFYMYSISDSTGKSGDTGQVDPETPDTILVSAATHIIHEVL
ncbi:MAG: hypothetical protein HXX13_17490 [Bacteroidetes bacterium]|nr:hypothetical protein [Bacteroidota bacterium]